MAVAGVADMDIGTAGGVEETESDDGNSIVAFNVVVLEKAELLRLYPLMREPLRALDKPNVTIHVVLDSLTALAHRVERVGIAYHRRRLE